MLFLDPGNSNYKARDSKGREIKALSVIAKPKDAVVEKPLWLIDNRYVGKDAILHGEYQDYSLDEIKTSQSTFQIMTKFMLCNYKAEDKIVFLFPFKTYFSERKKIIEIFSRKQDIVYRIGNEILTHKFDPKLVKALPQGYVTGMDYYLDENGKPRREIPNVVLIVDIGMGTSNYIYMLRGQLIEDMCHTTKNGMHQIYKRNPFDKRVYEIDLYYGYGALDNLSVDLATLIKSDISTFYNVNMIDEIVFVGGGSGSVFEYMPYKQKVLYPELPWIEDERGINNSQFAGVRGAEKVVANLSWGKMEFTGR